MEKIKLRYHHLLCINFFIGKGYSNEFVENFKYWKNKLEKENPLIEIVGFKDVICDKCPNWEDDKCATQDKVSRYDQNIENYLPKSGIYRYQELIKIIEENIINKVPVKDLCKDCEYLSICSNIQEQKIKH